MGTMGVTSLPVAFSEADFMIKGLYQFTLFGQELWITTTSVSLLIVSMLLIIFALFARHTLRNAKDVPSGFQNVLELMFEALEKMGESVLGANAPRFLNYISTIFFVYLVVEFQRLAGA